MGKLVGRDAPAGVANRQSHAAIDCLSAQRDRPAPRRVPQRVGYQIAHDLVEPAIVGGEAQFLRQTVRLDRQRDTGRFGLATEAGGYVMQEIDHVDLRYRNGFAARVPGFREPARKAS